MSNRIVIGVDVGGTFTDILALDETAGAVKVAKTPSTRGDQSVGFLEGILKVTDDLGQVATIIHGTTVATNALLERKGAKTGIITTAGFRDVLEMRRRDRPTTWGLWGQFTPVVERVNRLEVKERVLADGTIRDLSILKALNPQLRRFLQTAVKRFAVLSAVTPIQKMKPKPPECCGIFGRMIMSVLRLKFCLKFENLNGVRPPRLTPIFSRLWPITLAV